MTSDPIPSESLEARFRALRTEDVLAFVADQRQEDLTLEFKTAPSIFAERDDRRNLAEAISGFANSSGGLIVWGVVAKRNAQGVDSARQAQPLADGQLFLSRLTEHAGTATSPRVPALHRLIEGPGGPFAVSYVPETDGDPCMAEHGHSRYFKRSSGSFYRMAHFDVADMFGRRRRPVLAVLFALESNGASVRVSIRNDGRGPALAPYLSLRLPNNFRVSRHGVDGSGSFGLPTLGTGPLRARFGGRADFVIHPGQTLDVAITESTTTAISGAPVPKGRQKFGYEVAAIDAPLTSGSWEVDLG